MNPVYTRDALLIPFSYFTLSLLLYCVLLQVFEGSEPMAVAAKLMQEGGLDYLQVCFAREIIMLPDRTLAIKTFLDSPDRCYYVLYMHLAAWSRAYVAL